MAALLSPGCGSDVEEAPPVARPVKMMTVGGPGAGGTLDFPGQIRPAQQADMGFEVAGKLTEFLVDEGQVVDEGAVLARIDPRDYESKLAEVAAKVSQAKKDVERYHYLFEQGVNSRRDLELKERNYEVFRAEYATAKKAVDDAVLRAPFAGTVARKLVEDFANVQAKQTVLVLQDDSSLEVRVSVPERDLAGGRPGAVDYDEVNGRIQPVVTISAIPDREFPARLTEVATAADPTTRTYQATFAFEKPADANVLPGMTAKVRIQLVRAGEEAPTGFSIPVGAVVTSAENEPFVWTVDPDSLAVSRRPVTLGEMRGENVEVRSGIAAGDVIATSGLRLLQEGQVVRRYEEPAAQ